VPVIIIVLVVAALVVAGFVLARKGAGKAQARVDAALAGVAVLRREKATLQRVRSAGEAPARGLGVLALTPEELVFVQYVPEREVRVPRAAVSAVAADDGALVVTWADDEAAWSVDDPTAWREALQPT
jgi:hypothetical protein